MQVGDLVTGTPASFQSRTQSIGLIVGINPLDGRFMVKWNDLDRAYPESEIFLEKINVS